MAQTSLISWLEGVLHMREGRIYRDCNYLTSDFFEFLSLVIEGNDFGWADECEIKGIEEEDNVFALVGADVYVGEVVVVPGLGYEVGSWFSDQ